VQIALCSAVGEQTHGLQLRFSRFLQKLLHLSRLVKRFPSEYGRQCSSSASINRFWLYNGAQMPETADIVAQGGTACYSTATVSARSCHQATDLCSFECRACALHDRLRAFMRPSSCIVVLAYS